MIADSGNLITKAVIVSAIRMLCSIDQRVRQPDPNMAVRVSTGFILEVPKYRPQCRHTGSRKALDVARNSGPLCECSTYNVLVVWAFLIDPEPTISTPIRMSLTTSQGLRRPLGVI